jgi:DNA repair exonuclease SbcCD nuclease subunit
MRLLITGDWQVQTSNLEVARQALAVELALLKKYKVDAHIDLGDGKEEYSPVAVGVTNFQVERARQIATIVGKDKAFRLLGNHDRIGQHSDSRNWLTVFSDHCECITEPKLNWVLQSVLLVFLPFNKDLDNSKQQSDMVAELTKKNGRKAVLFFHGDIKGARQNNVSSYVSDSKFDTKALHHKSYMQCFGGHIHKRQTLDGNVHYVGNPFPTDMGEVNQEKGFILYDTDTDKIKFISSGLPCIYTLEYLKKKGILKVPDGTQIKHTVSVSATEDYYEVLGKASAEIERKYPNALPFVLPDFVEGVKKIEDSGELTVDASELEQIKSYLDMIGSEDRQRPAVEAYMRYVLGAIARKAGYAKGLVFESVEAANILSFKNAVFNFRNKGVCLIRGVNKDWPGHSNGSGKSNLLGLLPIAHSGRTFKDQRFGELVNDFTPDEKAWVRLKVTTKTGDALDIYRQFNPSKLQFTVNGQDASQGMRSNGKKDTQGLIEELTGYTFSTLANAVYIDQSMTQSFLLGTDKDRAELLHKFQNLDRFTLAQKVANQHISLMKAIVNDVEYATDMQEILLKETRERIVELEALQKDHLVRLRKEWQISVKAFESYKSRVSPQLKKWLAKEEQLGSLIEKQELEVKEADSDLFRRQAALQWHTLLFRKTLKAFKKGVCSSCFQPISKKHRIVTRQELKEKWERLSADVSSRESVLTVSKAILERSEEKANDLSSKIASRKEELGRLRQVANAALSFYRSEKKSVSGDSAKALHTKVALIKRKMSSLHKLRDTHLTTMEVVAKASKAFGRDGLPLFLNKLVCPRLNAASKYYSELFVNNEIQVLFLIEGDRLVPKIVNSHGGKRISGQSMGEKAWAGIITAFAVRDIAQPTNLLILDEPGAGLDPAAAKQLGARLSKLTDKFETLLVVTHNQGIEAALGDSNTVTVTKKNRISTIG